jgi:hypothetical protein
MKRFTIAMSLFALILMTGSAFAQPQLKYDDYDDVTIVETERSCNWFVNSFGFPNHKRGICFSMSMYFPGEWATMQALTQGVKRENGAMRKKHPGMRLYAEIIVHHPSWVFVNKVEAKINGKKFTIAGDTFSQTEVISGGHIAERSWAEIDQDSYTYKEFWRPILNGKVSPGTELVTRIYGQNGHVTYKETIK